MKLYIVIITGLLALTTGCKKTTADPQNTGTGSATIKLTQNGQVVTEFTISKVSGINDSGYTVVIASMDEKHSLVLDIVGSSASTYPFINSTQTLGSGKANFLYQSYALPAVYVGTVGILVPSAGQVVVKTATKTRCGGTFSSSGTNAKDNKTYTLEGSFDSPVQN